MPNAHRQSAFTVASLYVSTPRGWWSTAAGASSTASRRGVGASSVESQDASEGAPEVRVEDRVYDRVEETVDVAEPRDEADDGRRDGATTQGAAERADRRDDEERQPADDERPGDNGQRPRRLPLPPSASTTLPVATQLLRVAAEWRASSRQDVHEVLSVTVTSLTV